MPQPGDFVAVIDHTDDPQWPERFGRTRGRVNYMTDPTHALVHVLESENRDAVRSNIIFPVGSLRVLEEE